MNANRDWCLGQTVRQMDTDEVVDLVVRLTDERDQALIRAQTAEQDLDEWEAMRNEWRDKAFAHFDEAERQRIRAEAAETELDAYQRTERVEERRAS